MRLLATVLAAITVLSGTSARAQGISVSVSPASPTVRDNVVVTVSGQLGCGNDTLTSAHTISGDEIAVTVTHTAYTGLCPAVVVPFSVSEDLGMLALGQYHLTVTMGGHCCSPCNDVCIETADFTVGNGPSRLPSTGGPIPNNGSGANTHGLLLISGGLVLLAIASLRRKAN
jgi:hypothetical protein